MLLLAIGEQYFWVWVEDHLECRLMDIACESLPAANHVLTGRSHDVEAELAHQKSRKLVEH